jgi:hypothetical protein
MYLADVVRASSWPGEVPAIHEFRCLGQDVDGRDKHGHDVVRERAEYHNCFAQ